MDSLVSDGPLRIVKKYSFIHFFVSPHHDDIESFVEISFEGNSEIRFAELFYFAGVGQNFP